MRQSPTFDNSLHRLSPPALFHFRALVIEPHCRCLRAGGMGLVIDPPALPPDVARHFHTAGRDVPVAPVFIRHVGVSVVDAFHGDDGLFAQAIRQSVAAVAVMHRRDIARFQNSCSHAQHFRTLRRPVGHYGVRLLRRAKTKRQVAQPIRNATRRQQPRSEFMNPRRTNSAQFMCVAHQKADCEEVGMKVRQKPGDAARTLLMGNAIERLPRRAICIVEFEKAG